MPYCLQIGVTTTGQCYVDQYDALFSNVATALTFGVVIGVLVGGILFYLGTKTQS